jgi:hypothetical protein
MPQRVDVWASRYVLSGALVVAITIAVWMVRRLVPGIAAAWFAFLLVMLPMLGVVQNGPQIVADRYTYHAAPILGLLAGAAGHAGTAHRHGAVRRPSVCCSSRRGDVAPDGILAHRAVVVACAGGFDVSSCIAIGDLLIAGPAAEAASTMVAESSRSRLRGRPQISGALARDGQFADAVVEYKVRSQSTTPTPTHTTIGESPSRRDGRGRRARSLRSRWTHNAVALTTTATRCRTGRPLDTSTGTRPLTACDPGMPTRPNFAAPALLGAYAEAAERFQVALELVVANRMCDLLARSGQLAPTRIRLGVEPILG